MSRALGVLMVLLGACGQPGGEDDIIDEPGGGGGGTVTQDKTPINQEFDLGFDGEVPDIVMGKDGTLHLMYRVTAGPRATLYYSRKSPTDNVWTPPIEVPGSNNSCWRWFAWPDMGVGPDGTVHFIWMPDPGPLNNGLFYSKCLKCDGSDWSGRSDGSGNRFSKLSGDTVEFAEVCVGEDKFVHIVATQLDRLVPPHKEQDDQMVHYYSTNNGDNWEPNKFITKPQAFEDLSMKCIGNQVHLMMRFKQVYYARYLADGTGARSWVIQANLPHAGPNLSEINFFNDANGNLTGYAYSSWEYRDPLGVHYTKPTTQETQTLTPEMNFRLRVNGVIAGENSRGQRAAVWADIDGFLHNNDFNGTAWTGDRPFTDLLKPLNTTSGLAPAGIYSYSPGHGWQGRILWPATAIGEYNGAFHIVYRAITEATSNGTTKAGRFHYVKYQPFEPTNDHSQTQ